MLTSIHNGLAVNTVVLRARLKEFINNAIFYLHPEVKEKAAFLSKYTHNEWKQSVLELGEPYRPLPPRIHFRVHNKEDTWIINSVSIFFEGDASLHFPSRIFRDGIWLTAAFSAVDQDNVKKDDLVIVLSEVDHNELTSIRQTITVGKLEHPFHQAACVLLQRALDFEQAARQFEATELSCQVGAAQLLRMMKKAP